MNSRCYTEQHRPPLSDNVCRIKVKYHSAWIAHRILCATDRRSLQSQSHSLHNDNCLHHTLDDTVPKLCWSRPARRQLVKSTAKYRGSKRLHKILGGTLLHEGLRQRKTCAFFWLRNLYAQALTQTSPFLPAAGWPLPPKPSISGLGSLPSTLRMAGWSAMGRR